MTVVAVGNDVVDLLDPRTHGKHLDTRFIARVLADAERHRLAEARDPSLELWAFWAAKEAAYKVVSKLLGAPPIFAHAAFRASWLRTEADRWSGSVSYEHAPFPVLVARHETMVHAVATSGADPGEARVGAEALAAPRTSWEARLAELLPTFTPREAGAVHSFPSAAVRLRARRTLAEVLGVGESALEIVCDPGVTGRRPPRVLMDGQPAPADVSLSHHGAWIGWAVLPQNAVGR